MNTSGLETIIEESRKIGVFCKAPRIMDSHDVRSCVYKHECPAKYATILAGAKNLFLMLFAEKCFDEKVFVLPTEKVAESMVDYFDNPVVDFLYKRPLKSIAKVMDVVKDPIECAGSLMTQINMALVSTIYKVNEIMHSEDMFPNSDFDYKILMLEDSRPIMAKWIEKYSQAFLFADFSRNTMSLFSRPMGCGTICNFLVKKGCFGAWFDTSKELSAWLKEYVERIGDKTRSRDYQQGEVLAKGLLQDVDFLQVVEIEHKSRTVSEILGEDYDEELREVFSAF